MLTFWTSFGTSTFHNFLSTPASRYLAAQTFAFIAKAWLKSLKNYLIIGKTTFNTILRSNQF